MNTITAAPEASPSRPSVRFTPFAVAAIMTYAQITNRVDPTAPAANTTLLSRTNETVREAGVSPEWLRKPSASTANAIDTSNEVRAATRTDLTGVPPALPRGQPSAASRPTERWPLAPGRQPARP